MSRQTLFLLAGPLLFAELTLAQLDRSGPPTTVNSLARDPARVEAGANQFRQLCTGCHGRGGEGGQGEGQGPNLATAWEVRRAKDPELFGFIKNGVKGTAMPAFPLPDEQIWALAAFVRSLNAPAISLPVKGSVAAGEALFFGKADCSECHMIRGRGGYLGPDLSDIGASRRVGELQDALTRPSSEPSPDFRSVLIKDSQGHTLRAVAKHVSPWSAIVLDERGSLHLLHGDAVPKLEFQGKSWMPNDYAKRLSEAEVTDLVAYMSRQGIRPSALNADAAKNKGAER